MVLQLLCALLIFTQICQAKEQAPASSDLLVCATDYWLNISCFLDSRAIPKRMENITYQLKFNMTKDNINFCSLTVEKNGYSCIFKAKVAAHRSSFTNNHEFQISLCELKECELLKSSYKPAHHIKPITPYNLTVQYENGNYTFKWNSGYETHTYGQILPFEYILRYQPVGQSTRKELHTKQTKYTIPETHFALGTEYITIVYNKILQNVQYNGTTSHGSTEIRWKTRPVPLQSTTSGAGTSAVSVESGIVIPICLAVGLMSLLLFPVARMKIKKIAFVKTPAPHISPLNQTAQCNIQLWHSKGHIQQIYSEEISTIDMITEITARQQLPEHTTDVYSQCHTPYVGPLPEFWAPCLTSDTCITDNNLCTKLDFLPDDCDVQETLLSLSKLEAVESFVSLDDLEPNLEICNPTEVLTFTPNSAQNYCTLTNSDIGLIPTFRSVQCVPNLGLRLNDHSAPDLLNMKMEENTPELDTVTLDNLQLSIEE